MNALEIQNLCKSYSGFWLDNISLTLPTGCIMGLVGENGAGKSTIINLILGLIGRDGGKIKILGRDNRELSSSAKEQIGVVLDEACFPETLSAKNINKIMRQAYKTWSEADFFKLLDRFSLPPGKTVKAYSRGMKMKLSIAVALAHDPKFLILDEATSGLDPIVRDELLDLFFEFIQDEEHSIFMSSHITSDLEKVCDYISFIHKGKLLFCEEKDVLLERMGILKCSREDFQAIDPEAVRGSHATSFGVEALVERKSIPADFLIERPRLEDIIIFTAKEER